MDPLLWVVVGAAVLSGFFALTGTALRSFRRVQLEEAFGPSGQRRLELLERQLKVLRLATSFSRSLCNLVLVVGMLYLLDAPSRGWGRAVAAMAAAGAIIAVFGVAIPHAWASCAGEKVLARTLGALLVVRYALYPALVVMQAFDVLVWRLAGAAEPQGEDSDSAKEEILQAASEGHAEGAVDAEEVEMIESVMEFGEIQAGEIMTPRTDIFALPAGTAWDEACRQIFQAGHTRVPIFEADLDNIVGILYAKDLLQYVGQPPPAGLRSVMRKPFFVPETKRLDDLLKEFKARKVHIAVVLDEYGGTAGLVSIEDVLEEIVGEISDEYDLPQPALMKRIDDRTAEVDGRMYIDDLNEAMELEIPEDEGYDTVAGFVFSELGYIPAPGEKLQSHGAEFAVLAADERKITRLRVAKLVPAEEHEA